MWFDRENTKKLYTVALAQNRMIASFIHFYLDRIKQFTGDELCLSEGDPKLASFLPFTKRLLAFFILLYLPNWLWIQIYPIKSLNQAVFKVKVIFRSSHSVLPQNAHLCATFNLRLSSHSQWLLASSTSHRIVKTHCAFGMDSVNWTPNFDRISGRVLYDVQWLYYSQQSTW